MDCYKKLKNLELMDDPDMVRENGLYCHYAKP